jgi:SAM-dependent methyltransferase
MTQRYGPKSRWNKLSKLLNVPHALRWLFYVQLYLKGGRFLFESLLHGKKSFVFNGESYRYWVRRHNFTYFHERCVELPIMARLLSKYRDRQVLEIGNVMLHYDRSLRHRIVDKFEKHPCVTNADVVDFASPDRFDLIFSISTLEHVGWDDDPRDPGRVLLAVEHLKELLAPGGVLVVSAPLGYNPHFDQYVFSHTLGLESSFLKRLGPAMDWQEVDVKDCVGAQYDFPYPCGNVVFIGKYEKAANSRFNTSID